MQIDIPRYAELRPLERVLENVHQPGSFYASGKVELPMPRIQVQGVGTLSFPIPGQQAAQLVSVAQRAPYGRGEQTLTDTAVRKVWQLSPEQLCVSGSSWTFYLEQILVLVSEQLGCEDTEIQAELYKMLIYDPGSFFLSHRDSEKSAGMFATLVLVLPSAHQGGALLVRHNDQEVKLDLSDDEVSAISFAAFYADCEHELQQVTTGYRVCLVYNLIQPPGSALMAADYSEQSNVAARLLRQAFSSPDAPQKLVWLLEHQYTQSNLSFAMLKGVDAARAALLTEAAEQADCAVHLAQVHIEEYGAAESYIDDRRYSYDWEREVDEDDYEIIDVAEENRYLNQWCDTNDCEQHYGDLPLAEGELLPAGALDNEPFDRQRLTEATGNAGASYERAYLRAVVVIWPNAGFADVLLQRGIDAALPLLAQHIETAREQGIEADKATELARRMLDLWLDKMADEQGYGWRYGGDINQMLCLLTRLGDSELMQDFVGDIVLPEYNGKQNQALADAAPVLGEAQCKALFAALIQQYMPSHYVACSALLAMLAETVPDTASWKRVLAELAAIAVPLLRDLQPAQEVRKRSDWNRYKEVCEANDTMLSDLLRLLSNPWAETLLLQACDNLTINSAVFDPVNVLAPGLLRWHNQQPEPASFNPPLAGLWQFTVDALLSRSEYPPAPPENWQQQVKITCPCADCAALQTFAWATGQQEHYFRVATERRQHLHQTIERYQLDMTHVTERSGRPFTLVCRKTLGGYSRACAQHKKELGLLQGLAQMMDSREPQTAERLQRIHAACKRQPAPCELA